MRGADDLDPVERLVADVVRVGQDGDVGGRQPVAAGQRPGRRVVDLQQPARRVMLQPFPDIAFDGPGPPGQRPGRE